MTRERERGGSRARAKKPSKIDYFRKVIRPPRTSDSLRYTSGASRSDASRSPGTHSPSLSPRPLSTLLAPPLPSLAPLRLLPPPMRIIFFFGPELVDNASDVSSLIFFAILPGPFCPRRVWLGGVMSLPSRLAIATAATIARVGSSSHSLPSLSLAATLCAVAAASIRAARRAAARPTAAASRAATVPGGPRRRPAQRPQRSGRLGRAHVAARERRRAGRGGERGAPIGRREEGRPLRHLISTRHLTDGVEQRDGFGGARGRVRRGGAEAHERRERGGEERAVVVRLHADGGVG